MSATVRKMLIMCKYFHFNYITIFQICLPLFPGLQVDKEKYFYKGSRNYEVKKYFIRRPIVTITVTYLLH